MTDVIMAGVDTGRMTEPNRPLAQADMLDE